MKLVRKNRELTVEVFRSTRGQFAWHVVQRANGRIVATAGEQFHNKADVFKIAARLYPHLPVVDLT